MHIGRVSGSIPKTNRLWTLVTVALMVIATPRITTAEAPQAATVVPRSDTLVLCIQSPLDSLDPTNHRSRNTQRILKNIFDSLTTRDNANKVLPQLAESWRLIDDTEWQFTLRKGVRFHNGQCLTSTDVKYTLERVIVEGAIDGGTSPRKSLLDAISRVDIEDDLRVRIHTRYPWPNLPLMLSIQEIIPSDYMQKVGSDGFEKHPIGTGPFQWVSGNPGTEFHLKRFDDYYGCSPLKPPVQVAPLQQLVIKVVSSKLDQMVMLKTGRTDMILNVPPESIPILEMSPHIRILKVPATRSYFAEINCTKPPFDDVRVRRALNQAVDMDAVVTHKLQGQAKALSTVLLPNSFGFNPELRPYPYDLATARRLLNAAAFPADRSIAIHFSGDDHVFADSLALFLTKLGLSTRITVSPVARPDTTGPAAPWDIFVGSWGNSTLDPMGILLPKFKSMGPANYSGYSSTLLDHLMIQAQSTMDDDQRVTLYHRIQKILFDTAPMVFGYAPDEFYAVSDRVRNFTPSSTGMIELHDVYFQERE